MVFVLFALPKKEKKIQRQMIILKKKKIFLLFINIVLFNNCWM